MTSTPTSSITYYFLPSSSSMSLTRPLLAALFLSWLTIVISIITLLLLLHATHLQAAGYSWRLMTPQTSTVSPPPPPAAAAASSSSSAAAAAIPTLVLRKALSVYKLDLSSSNVRFHYVKHSHGHHHHHHHHHSHVGPVQTHSPPDHHVQLAAESESATAATVGLNSYGSTAAVAERIVAPPDPLYRYPVVTTSSPVVDPHSSTVYGDEKRLVPTGPNPLHH